MLSTTRESASKHSSELLSHLPSSDGKLPATPNRRPCTFGSCILGCCVSEMEKVMYILSVDMVTCY